MDYYNQYKGLIHHIIEHHFKSYMNTMYEDMYSTGKIALLYGIQKYDETKNASIKTFLYTCIKNAIQGMVNKETMTNKQQCRVSQLSTYIYNKSKILEENGYSNNSIYNIIYDECKKDERFKHITSYNFLCAWNIAMNHFICSTTQNTDDDNNIEYDIVSSDKSASDILLEKDMIDSIIKIIHERFSDYQCKIFIIYMNGIIDGSNITMQEIADRNSISKQYVSRVITNIKKYLKNNKERIS